MGEAKYIHYSLYVSKEIDNTISIYTYLVNTKCLRMLEINLWPFSEMFQRNCCWPIVWQISDIDYNYYLILCMACIATLMESNSCCDFVIVDSNFQSISSDFS